MPRFGDGRAFPSAVLVMVAAWALAAATMLMATYSSARDIEDDVDFIVRQTSGIDHDTETVEVASRTAELTGEIGREVEPLEDKLTVVVRESESIGNHAESVASSAKEVRRSVDAISTEAGDIQATSAAIAGRLETVLGEARGIDEGVAGINVRAGQVIDLTRALRADLADILAEVGLEHGSPPDATLHGHANSIDCSPALVAFSTHCQE